MSEMHMSLRVMGDLPPLEDLIHLFGTSPTSYRHASSRFDRKSRRSQLVDVWNLELIGWWRGRADQTALAQAVVTLQRMTPALASLDRAHCRAQVYISAIRDEESGGFELPAELIAAAGVANLELVVSILCDAGDDDDGDEHDQDPKTVVV